MKPRPDWKHSVVSAFDDPAPPGLPPLNNAFFDHGGIRLFAFRSDTGWLVVFEWVAFHLRSDNPFVIEYSVFGSDSESSRWPRHHRDESRIVAVSPTEMFDEKDRLLLDPHDFTVSVRGVEQRILTTDDDYKAAEIDRSKLPNRVAILRMVVHRFGDELFSTPEEILKIVGRDNVGLQPFLVVKEWQHVTMDEDGEISDVEDSPAFTSLAEALAAGDPSLFTPGTPNTHYRNIPRYDGDSPALD